MQGPGAYDTTPSNYRDGRKGGDHLTESLSGVDVAHLHDGDASACHRIAQLPFVREQSWVKLNIKGIHKIN